MFNPAWCILIAATLVACGDRGAGPTSEARIVLDVRYRPAGGAAKVGEVQRVSRMVATVYQGGRQVGYQALAYERGAWRGTLKVTPASYVIVVEAFKDDRVRWRGSTKVQAQGGKTHRAVIEMASTNRAPVLAAVGDQGVAEGGTLRIELSASDADGDDLTYSVSGHPPGSSLSENTFRWDPTHEQAGAYEVTFTVSDEQGGTDSETITITVEETDEEAVGDAQVVGEIEEETGDAEVVGEIEEDSGDAEIVGEIEE